MKLSLRQAAFFAALPLLLCASCSRPRPAAPPSSSEDSAAQTEQATGLMQRALEERRAHRWDEALADYRAAKSLAPDDPEVRRGVKLFERLGKFLSEIRDMDARVAAAPQDDGILTDRALLFLRSDDAELALSDSEAAERQAPWAVRPKLFRALALIALGRGAEGEAFGVDRRIHLSTLTPEFLETISRLDSEISIERDNADLYTSRAWQLNEIAQPRLALADADLALQLDPQSAAAQAERSYALSKLGHADEALEAIQRATEFDPKLASAWQYRGELELARGELPAAIESLSQALVLSPTVGALQKREHAHRQLGETQKADEDLHALQALSGN